MSKFILNSISIFSHLLRHDNCRAGRFSSILTVNEFRLKSEVYAESCQQNQVKLAEELAQINADDFKQIGVAFQACDQTKALAEKLIEQGEPIGIHYYHVGEYYKAQFKEKWKSSSATAKQRAMEWANSQVLKTSQKRTSTMDRISQLYREKSYKEAEELLDPMLYEMSAFVPFLPQDRQSKLKRPFAG